jgi:hypothetical protein
VKKKLESLKLPEQDLPLMHRAKKAPRRAPPPTIRDLGFKASFARGIKMLRGKRFHFDGYEGKVSTFSECESDLPVSDRDERTVIKVQPAVPGQPLKYGERLCHLSAAGEDHYQFEEVTRGKPAMVSSAGYRAGWDRVFGSNYVN